MTATDAPIPVPPTAPRRVRWLIDLRHQADLHLALGLSFPVAAGVALFGWRAFAVCVVIGGSALIARALLARLRTWTAASTRLSLLVQAVTVALFCPATLFDADRAGLQPDARWPTLVAVGFFLALANWALGRAGRRRVHPAVLTAALLTLMLPTWVETQRVLPPQKMVTGDVLDARVAARPTESAGPWMDAPRGPERAFEMTPAARTLQDFLHGLPPPGRTNQTVARLLSDDLPPLEDLIVGGHPTPLGRGSVVALVIGGLFLVYRRATPLRVPAMALLACYATLAVLPLPAGVGGGARRWLFERDARVGWAAGLTLVHYLLAASAVPLTATFLLPQAGVRPAGRRMAAVFAVVFGALAAAATVFVSVAGGALLALLIVQFAWPPSRAKRTATATPVSVAAPAPIMPA